MDIGALRSRIIIQEIYTEVDDVGNHVSKWRDYFKCWATVSGATGGGNSGGQSEDAGQTTDHSDMSFTVRYSSETSRVTLKSHRISFDGDIYDIVGVDLANMKKKSLKFKCRKQPER